MVDGEVAERVRLGDGGQGEHRGHGEEEQAPHDDTSPSSARPDGVSAAAPRRATRAWRAAAVASAGAGRGHRGVQVERGIERAGAQRPARPREPGARVTRARERPAERVRGADARRGLPHAAAEAHRPRGRAVLGLEDHGLGVRAGAAAAQQRVLGTRRGEIGVRGAIAPERGLDLREQRQRGGQRKRSGRAAQAGGGRPKVAARRVHSREPGEGLGVGGEGAQGLAVGVARGGHAAASELEVAHESLHVGAALGGSRGGRRQPHGRHGAGRVARQLAQVGGARVCGEARLEVEQPLNRRGGVVIAAELDLRVRDDRVGAHEVRLGAAGVEAELELLAELVPQARERAGADQGAHVARVAHQGGVEGALRA